MATDEAIIGMTLAQAEERLRLVGYVEIASSVSINDKQNGAETNLVIRAKLDFPRAELVATPFIMQEFMLGSKEL